MAASQPRHHNTENLHEPITPAETFTWNTSKNSPRVLPERPASHTSKSGLNPLVDAASYLLSVLGKLKQFENFKALSQLQQELIDEINYFQENVKSLGYHLEVALVCRYILCATFDDIITNTSWGSKYWNEYFLLNAFNQDTQQDKFFTILNRAVKEPKFYIDLMELMYLCLSMGYLGKYRNTEHSHLQLEQILDNLYKHIRAYRGSFSKVLSPTPLKRLAKRKFTLNKISLLFIFLVTACAVMTIFIGLGYLMDTISNEAYKTLENVAEHTIPRS